MSKQKKLVANMEFEPGEAVKLLPEARNYSSFKHYIGYVTRHDKKYNEVWVKFTLQQPMEYPAEHLMKVDKSQIPSHDYSFLRLSNVSQEKNIIANELIQIAQELTSREEEDKNVVFALIRIKQLLMCLDRTTYDTDILFENLVKVFGRGNVSFSIRGFNHYNIKFADRVLFICNKDCFNHNCPCELRIREGHYVAGINNGGVEL